MVPTEIEDEQNQSSENGNEEKEKLSKDVYIIAQEIKMVKSLTSHDPIQRDKQLRKLQKWLKIRSNSSFSFTEEDFLRIWKGLYFSMWMCDKPLNQENLAEDLGKLLKCFNNIEVSIQFFGAFLKTMCLEWFGIDQWRIDKFMMLVRRMFRAMFQNIKDEEWSNDCIELFSSKLLESVLKENAPIGLAMHVTDIYLEELAKIADNEILGEQITQFIKPFIHFLAIQKDFKLLGYTRNRIFYNLMWQSDRGREYNEKYNAWKEMGFPTASIDDLEKVAEESEASENEQEEENHQSSSKEKNFDPRAGNVDVFIPALPVEAKEIISNLEGILYKEVTNTKSRRFIRTILEKYHKFEAGEFPLGIKKMPVLKVEPFKELVSQKVVELDKLESTLYGTTRTLKKLNKRKRKKLLSSLDFDNLDEETFEEVLKNKIESTRKRKHLSTNDEWIEEDIVPPNESSASNENLKNNANENTKVEKNKKKQKKSKQNEKENSSNAANHNQSLQSNGVSEWEESDYTPTPKKKISDCNKNSNEKQVNEQAQNVKDEWDKPLQDGEVEYFLPSRKLQVSKANSTLELNSNDSIKNVESTSNNLVLNPFAKKANKLKINDNNKQILLGKSMKKAKSTTSLVRQNMKYETPQQQKKVKIALQKNTVQKPSDYIQQVRSSPQLPYDATKMPTKGLLKPNSTPSPINPFLQNKFNLKYNESF